MILPALAGFMLLFIVPTLMSFAYSITNWSVYNPELRIVGIKNFAQLFSDEKYAVGSIKESNTVDIFKSNQCNELIDFFRLGVKYMNGCDKCVWKSSCGRGCIALCVSNGSIQETDGNCYLRKKQLLSDLK